MMNSALAYLPLQDTCSAFDYRQGERGLALDPATQKDKARNCSAARNVWKRNTMHERRKGGSKRGRTLTAQRGRGREGNESGEGEVECSFSTQHKT